jgi:hypothetical protein
MLRHNKDYNDLMKSYLELFDAVDRYLRKYPAAKFKYDELNETKPGLGFVHYEGQIECHAYFYIK